MTDHRFYVLVTVVAAALIFLIAGTADARAATNRPCVTRAEYRAVHKGQTLDRVARIIGGRGHLDSRWSYGGDSGSSRTWRQCGGYGSAWVTFANGRADGKGAYWTYP
jgi:hypothetical protein